MLWYNLKTLFSITVYMTNEGDKNIVNILVNYINIVYYSYMLNFKLLFIQKRFKLKILRDIFFIYNTN